MSNNRHNRIINTHHVETVLEVKDRTARNIMRRMRKHFAKEKHQPIILQEFLEYTKLPLEFVLEKLGWNKP
ncbi:MAG: hypothetical protein J7621_21800 [Niastella sp.]|nr:hypothetical protein [Niastella sp.]